MIDLCGQLTFTIQFVQSCLGLISANIRMIAFEVVDNCNFNALFILKEDDIDTQKDIADIIDEFETYQEQRVHVSLEIIINKKGKIGSIPNSMICIYSAKE